MAYPSLPIQFKYPALNWQFLEELSLALAQSVSWSGSISSSVYGSDMLKSPLLLRTYTSNFNIGSMCGCLGKLGSVSADIITPIIYRSTNSLSWAFWIAAYMNMVAFLIVIVLNLIDQINDKRRKKLRLIRKN